MRIEKLLDLIQDVPSYRRLLSGLPGGRQALVREEARPYLLAALYRHLQRPLLVIVAKPEESRKLAEQMAAWLGRPVAQLPEPDALPYQRVSQDITTELERIEVLSALAHPNGTPPVVVASAPALAQKLPPAGLFRQARRELKLDMEIEPRALLTELMQWGYHTESLVEVPGQVAHRGGIVDIFTPTADNPVRLEFFGNSVDSLRTYEPVSQRSLRQIKEITLGPASELAPLFIGDKERIGQAFASLNLDSLNPEARREFEQALTELLEGQAPAEMPFYAALFNQDSLFSYLPPEALVVPVDAEGIRRELEFVHDEAEKVLADKLAERTVPAGFPRPYHTWADIAPHLPAANRLDILGWQAEESASAVRLDFAPAQSYAGQLARWSEKISDLLAQGGRLIAVSHQSSRLFDLLKEDGLTATTTEEITEIPQSGSLTLVQGILAGGWVLGGETYLFTDNELFGFLKQQRQAKRRPVARHQLYVDIKPGDYVVHVEHGIGRLAGVITMTTDGVSREYLLLQYAEGARLYVPTDQIDRVSHYIGGSDAEPALSRLGSLEWVKSKEKAREAAEEVARDMLKLYAERATVPGFVYSPDSAWQMELEASFPYVETPDQLTAIEQIKEDMTQTKPMDRLVCGDVGYGKTEVALRAAFKAVGDGKQVAVLVPTTVLAQQHYATFAERLAAFPVRVEVLSRFRTHREQEEVVQGLAEGKVDIVIGTHRLLQPDVKFKDLGLLIIDEEQRFGVSHKEHFKRLRREVDVLTLSATPIPRTLNLALSGVRDMSVMETPPEERLPIKTYVAEYDERLIREAIVRELERNGQVFFVHNRVQSIRLVADRLMALVPEARCGIGHGQMSEDELEAVMSDFTAGRLDVLLCTTIIESGLDVPNANTLIVNQADRLGLTQLYQLRGRVGRGANLAYAYFLYDKGKRLTSDAAKRLRTIFEATELGAGFGIAMKDLEIRGAGNILGLRQSGHIQAVGFTLYTQLLAEAVDDLRQEQAAARAGRPFVPPVHLPPPSIELPLAAFIPEDYVADTDIRLSLYQCLAGTRKLEAANVWAKDFQDRFGSLPPEVQNLLYAVRVKVLATRAALASVGNEGGSIVLRRPVGMQFDVHKVAPRLGVKASPYQIRLDVKAIGPAWQKALEEVLAGLAVSPPAA